MSAAVATDTSLLDGYHKEWRFLSEQSCNVLIEGTVTATEAVLHLLRPHIHEPIGWHRPAARLDLPSGEVRTFIVRDAAALSPDEQRRLLAWMDEAGSHTQVITTASRALFALVAVGRFDAALYYRLNVLLVRVSPPISALIAK